MKNPTYEQIAKDYSLFCDYITADTEFSYSEFAAMKMEEKISFIKEIFGEEDTEPELDDVDPDEYFDDEE